MFETQNFSQRWIFFYVLLNEISIQFTISIVYYVFIPHKATLYLLDYVTPAGNVQIGDRKTKNGNRETVHCGTKLDNHCNYQFQMLSAIWYLYL